MAEYNIEKDKVVYGQWVCFKNICPKCYNPISTNYCEDCKIEIEIREMPNDLKEDLRARSDTLNSILMYRKKKIKDRVNEIIKLNINIDSNLIDSVNIEMNRKIKESKWLKIEDLKILYRSIQFEIMIKERSFYIKIEIGVDRYDCAYSIRHKCEEFYPERESNYNFQVFLNHLMYFHNFLSESIEKCKDVFYNVKINDTMKKISNLLKMEEN